MHLTRETDCIISLQYKSSTELQHSQSACRCTNNMNSSRYYHYTKEFIWLATGTTGIVGTMFYTTKQHLSTKQDLYDSKHRINNGLKLYTEAKISKNLMALHSRTCSRLDNLEVRMEQSMNNNLKRLEDMHVDGKTLSV